MAPASGASSDRTRLGEDSGEDTPLLSGADIISNEATEDSPLLGNGSAKDPDLTPAGAPIATPDSDKPLPRFQILLLCYARMMEPIAFFSIFPFIAQMVQENGHLPKARIGFYSGLIESLFSATQMVVLVFWGRLADRIGRKPVLLWSLFGMAIAPALFGMSTSLWQMIFFRCVAGVFSGSSLIIRTMIAEHSTIKTQARAFSWFSFSGNVGIFLGPLIGGALADPVNQYPRAFKGVAFFENYPFALPGFVVAAIGLMGAIIIAIFLEETLVKPEGSEDGGPPGSRPAPARLSMGELIKSPGVGPVLWVYSHVMLLAFVFTAMVPIVLYEPVNLGGFGFTTFQISLFLANQGFFQALWLLFVFPFLQYRLGTKAVMKICTFIFPVVYLGYVLVNVVLRDGSPAGRVFFWIIGSFIAFIGPACSMAFTGTQLALNDVSPNPLVLGTLNAIALTLSSGIRAVVPAVASVIYAVGVDNEILWGHLAWVILIGLTLPLIGAVRWLPESVIPAKQHKNNDGES